MVAGTLGSITERRVGQECYGIDADSRLEFIVHFKGIYEEGIVCLLKVTLGQNNHAPLQPPVQDTADITVQ